MKRVGTPEHASNEIATSSSHGLGLCANNNPTRRQMD